MDNHKREILIELISDNCVSGCEDCSFFDPEDDTDGRYFCSIRDRKKRCPEDSEWDFESGMRENEDDHDYAYSFDGESYTGIFNSFDDALEDAKNSNPDHMYKEVWIGECVPCEYRWCGISDYVLDSMDECLSEDVGDCESVRFDKEIEQELEEMLDNTIREWVKKHKLKPSYFKVPDPDCYTIED